MVILKYGSAGTLESCDASVSVEPATGLLDLIVESAGDSRFAGRVREAALEILGELGVESGKVVVRDRSALDCTVRARVMAACLRAAGIDEIPWHSLAGKEGRA